MSPSSDAQASSPADVLGFEPGQIVQELGYADDVDLDLRDAIEDSIDADLEDEDCQEIVDGVVLWWRDGDGDLVDALVDALTTLAEGGPVWLLTPKAGRDGHVLPATVQESADLAGMRAMGTMSLAPDWSGTRLASRAA
ncbi:DUF3052 domain-containing protein [Brachybacterium nesterenkovii]|uniref:DUF3052 domain-containing protein n=1 Tax=Brachybacterium nesterenkovii TaxID=47847 RepID=A0A1X6WT74_9MICO|nr:DUF3052 domain-containing protein [Brachybacterium nesterenkovii]SLM88184.1 hypothetical protein FM110_01285 [Brachybacterium nesterenkovii]